MVPFGGKRIVSINLNAIASGGLRDTPPQVERHHREDGHHNGGDGYTLRVSLFLAHFCGRVADGIGQAQVVRDCQFHHRERVPFISISAT